MRTTRLTFPDITVRDSGIGAHDLQFVKADRVVCKEVHVV